eukprot:TRINITY_DN5322_c0_g1_i1.p1 TRINITY_DN5322_c0_g1~~TRINITY_DN5322_c0_g1_i1.p1  ORF type:complete len:415 (+),score=43.74 TRINITY_DN5322_c0_g1_i1:65-1246(+)
MAGRTRRSSSMILTFFIMIATLPFCVSIEDDCTHRVVWPGNWHLGPHQLELCAINTVATHPKPRFSSANDRWLRLPKTFPSHKLSMPTWALPSYSAVFQLDNGCVTGDVGLTFNSNRAIVNDRWHRKLPAHRPSLRHDFDHILINLVVIWGQHYQHLMLETVPRLGVLLKLHPELVHDGRVKYLINPGPAAGFLNQVYFPDYVDQLKIGLVPRDSFSEVLPKLRALANPASQAKPAILYLARDPLDARGVEPELERHLLRVLRARMDTARFELHVWNHKQSHGWQQDRTVFEKAAIIMGPHGGAFANLPFAPPTATVIEIIPWTGLRPPVAKDKEAPDSRPCYWAMATALGQTYYQFEPVHFGFHKRGVEFDAELLMMLLADLGALSSDASRS